MSTRPLAHSGSDSDPEDDGSFPSTRKYPPSRLERTSLKGRANRAHRLFRTYPLCTFCAGVLLLAALLLLSSPTRPAQTPERDSRLKDDFADLPTLAYKNGTRYPHPLPPSHPDPWPHRPEIAGRFLSSSAAAKRRKPQVAFEVPREYVAAVDAVLGKKQERWAHEGASRGEGFDKTGRPTKVSGKRLYDGKSGGWTPKKVGEPVELPRVQHPSFDRDSRSAKEKEQDEQRREYVRRAFQHVWGGYAEHAWGYDELKPLSGGSTNPFNGWSATIFDALDTLLIMGLQDEYIDAREHVAKVDYSYLTPSDPTSYPKPNSSALPPLSLFDDQEPLGGFKAYTSQSGIRTFETVIRYLGALLSAYDLSHDPLMLTRAVDLADWLLPSMATETGLLVPFYRMGAHPDGDQLESVCLAEVGSIGLEYLRLSQLTGDEGYFEAAQRSLDTLDTWPAKDRLRGLFPTFLNTVDRSSLHGTYTFGGQADSYYEYLIKLYQLLGGSSPSSSTEDPASQYARMYRSAIDAAHDHLIRPIHVVPGLEGAVTIGDVHYKEQHEGVTKSWFLMRLDHLTCFAGGMLGLGSRLLSRAKDFDTAVQFTKACTWAYDSTRTGLAPEIIELWSEGNPHRWREVQLDDGRTARTVRGDPVGVYSSQNQHIQRPETVESLFYLYRLTGDRTYQDTAWRFFTSWVETTINEGGFSHINDVNSDAPRQDDSGIESFVYGETLKYYYLIFSPPDLLSLDDWVFTTEAHPFRAAKPGSSSAASSSSSAGPFWQDGPELTMPDKVGEGSPVQKWARMVQAATVKGWTWERQRG
ncbi:hypothetical protein JCM6882_000314 [Rhodosporidiobolus microsporus]